MGFLDLTILEKIPELDQKVILEIEPLAPLSMVSELPGSYYQTLKTPDKKMLCGLFENILGWHISLADRKAVIKDVVARRKKLAKKTPFIEFVDRTKGSTFSPLLMDFFEIVLPVIPKSGSYDDLWSKSYRRSDAIVHPKGTFNISYELIPLKRELKRSEKNSSLIDDSALEQLFKSNLTKYPMFYSTPTKREYIYTSGKYQIQVLIDDGLLKLLKERVSVENLGYLGNSEGWVDIKFHEL